MKVHIYDTDALRAVSPAALANYVRAEGWQRSEAFGDQSDVYQKPGSQELVLPLNANIADYPAVISAIILALAMEEGRSETQVFRDLTVSNFDVVRSRAPLAGDDGSVALDAGVDLFVQSRELLLSAACSATDPRAFYRAGGVKNASSYMDRVRLGQTEQGSFVISLLAPVPMSLEEPAQGNLWPNMSDEPYERQVTMMLATGLTAAKKAAEGVVSGAGLSVFRTAIASGVSANSCAALGALAERDLGVEVSVSWARSRPTPEPRHALVFSQEEGEIFKEAARYFKMVEPRLDEKIEAFVVKLDRGPKQADGRITLKTFLDGKPVSIATELPSNLYGIAVAAHDDQKSVVIRPFSRLSLSGRHIWLTYCSKTTGSD